MLRVRRTNFSTLKSSCVAWAVRTHPSADCSRYPFVIFMTCFNSRGYGQEDHSRALRACFRGPPKDWRRRTGRPRQTWLRTVEDDLRPLNFGLTTARRRAMDRQAWRLLVDAAKSSWHARERERERERERGYGIVNWVTTSRLLNFDRGA